jgi:hypothetical protein
MTEPNLLVICLAAGTAVFLLLGTLAATMRLLGAIFPEQSDDADAALYAAIAAAAAQAHPGMRVTKIEESR